ncbi:MAG: bifunctional riboflavin kinase/FAD synthetase [Planktomarina sp.]
MKRFSTFPVPADARGAAAAIGNFDGVHRGHQAVLDQVRKAANGAPLGVVTFEPHPREYFAAASGQDAAPFRLMDAVTRAHRLEKLGVDFVYEIPFDADFAAMTPEAFCANVLRDDLGLSHVVVGADFCFGKGRAGNVNTLQQYGPQMGFDVSVAKLENMGDQTISSTNIRAALSDGDPRLAADMLGHWHRIDGTVEHGEKRGRELGFPTANLSLKGRHVPAHGVYAVTVDVLTGPNKGTYIGACSIGVRPMFGENTPNCETYIFDFDGDLYGQEISVGLIAFIRPELVFDGVDALIEQMHNDCQAARVILAGQ